MKKDWIEVTCYLRHVGGHEESVSMGGPPDAGGAKNAIQARASTKTYLERYTLKAITGLSEQDDDTDGNVDRLADISEVLSEWLSKVKEVQSIQELEKVWKDGVKVFNKLKNRSAYTEFKDAANKKKADFDAAKEAQ